MSAFLANALIRRLELYVKNLQKEQVSLSVAKGDIQLRDVFLNEDVVQEIIGTPNLKVVGAKCGHIQIRIPWRRIKHDPAIVDIDKLVIELAEPDVLMPVPKVIPVRQREEDSKKGIVDKIVDGLRIQVASLEILVKLRGVSCPTMQLVAREFMVCTTNSDWNVVDLRECRKENKGRSETIVYKIARCSRISATICPLDASVSPLEILRSVGASWKIKRKMRTFGLDLLSQQIETILEDTVKIHCGELQWLQLSLFVRSIRECFGRQLSDQSSTKDSETVLRQDATGDDDRIKRLKHRDKLEKRMSSRVSLRQPASLEGVSAEDPQTGGSTGQKRSFWKRFKDVVQKPQFSEDGDATSSDVVLSSDRLEDDFSDVSAYSRSSVGHNRISSMSTVDFGEQDLLELESEATEVASLFTESEDFSHSRFSILANQIIVVFKRMVAGEDTALCTVCLETLDVSLSKPSRPSYSLGVFSLESVAHVSVSGVEITEECPGIEKHADYMRFLYSSAEDRSSGFDIRYSKRYSWHRPIEEFPIPFDSASSKDIASFLAPAKCRVLRHCQVSLQKISSVIDRDFIEILHDYFSLGLRKSIKVQVEHRIEQIVSDVLHDRLTFGFDVFDSKFSFPPLSGFHDNTVSIFSIQSAKIVSDSNPISGTGYGSKYLSSSCMLTPEFPCQEDDISCNFQQIYPLRSIPSQMQVFQFLVEQFTIETKEHAEDDVSNVVVKDSSCRGSLAFFQWNQFDVHAPQLEVAIEFSPAKVCLTSSQFQYFSKVFPARTLFRFGANTSSRSRQRKHLPTSPGTDNRSNDTPPIPVFFCCRFRSGVLELVNSFDSQDILASCSFSNAELCFEEHIFERIFKCKIHAVSMFSPRHLSSPFYVFLSSTSSVSCFSMRWTSPTKFSLASPEVRQVLVDIPGSPFRVFASSPTFHPSVSENTSGRDSGFRFRSIECISFVSRARFEVCGMKIGYVSHVIDDILVFFSPRASSRHDVDRRSPDFDILSTYRARRALIKSSKSSLPDFEQLWNLQSVELFVVESLDTPECLPLFLKNVAMTRRKNRFRVITDFQMVANGLELYSLMWDGQSLVKRALSSPCDANASYSKDAHQQELVVEAPAVSLSLNRVQYELILRVVEANLRQQSAKRKKSEAKATSRSFANTKLVGKIGCFTIAILDDAHEHGQVLECIVRNISASQSAKSEVEKHALWTMDGIAIVDHVANSRAVPIPCILQPLRSFQTPSSEHVTSAPEDATFDVADLFKLSKADWVHSNCIRVFLITHIINQYELTRNWAVELCPLLFVYSPDVIRTLRTFFEVTQDTAILRSRYEDMKRSMRHLFAESVIASESANSSLPRITYLRQQQQQHHHHHHHHQEHLQLQLQQQQPQQEEQRAGTNDDGDDSSIAVMAQDIVRLSVQHCIVVFPEQQERLPGSKSYFVLQTAFRHVYFSNDFPTVEQGTSRIRRSTVAARDVSVVSQFVNVETEERSQAAYILSPCHLNADVNLRQRDGDLVFSLSQLEVDHVKLCISPTAFFTVMRLSSDTLRRIIAERRALRRQNSAKRSRAREPIPKNARSDLHIRYLDLVLMSDVSSEVDLLYVHGRELSGFLSFVDDVFALDLSGQLECMVNDVAYGIPEKLMSAFPFDFSLRTSFQNQWTEAELSTFENIKINVSRDMIQNLWTVCEFVNLAHRDHLAWLRKTTATSPLTVSNRRGIVSQSNFRYVIRNRTEGTIQVSQSGGVMEKTKTELSLGPGEENAYVFSNPFLSRRIFVALDCGEGSRLPQFIPRDDRVDADEAIWISQQPISCEAATQSVPVLFMNKRHSQKQRFLQFMIHTVGLQRVITLSSAHVIANNTDQELYVTCDTQSRLTRFSCKIPPFSSCPVCYDDKWTFSRFVVNDCEPFALLQTDVIHFHSLSVAAGPVNALSCCVNTSKKGVISFEPPVVFQNCSVFPTICVFSGDAGEDSFLVPACSARVFCKLYSSVIVRLHEFPFKDPASIVLRRVGTMRLRYDGIPHLPLNAECTTPCMTAMPGVFAELPVLQKRAAEFTLCVERQAFHKLSRIVRFNSVVLVRNCTPMKLMIRQKGSSEVIVVDERSACSFSLSEFFVLTKRSFVQVALANSEKWSEYLPVSVPCHRVVQLQHESAASYAFGYIVDLQDSISSVITILPWLCLENATSSLPLTIRLGSEFQALEPGLAASSTLLASCIWINDSASVPGPESVLDLSNLGFPHPRSNRAAGGATSAATDNRHVTITHADLDLQIVYMKQKAFDVGILSLSDSFGKLPPSVCVVRFENLPLPIVELPRVAYSITESGRRLGFKSRLRQITMNVLDEDKKVTAVCFDASAVQLQYVVSPPEESLFFAIGDLRAESLLKESEYQVLSCVDHSIAVGSANQVEMLVERLLVNNAAPINRFVAFRVLPLHLRLDGAVLSKLSHYSELRNLARPFSVAAVSESGADGATPFPIPKQYQMRTWKSAEVFSASGLASRNPVRSPRAQRSSAEGSAATAHGVFVQEFRVFATTVTLLIGENDRRLPSIHQPLAITLPSFALRDLADDNVRGVLRSISNSYRSVTEGLVLQVLGHLDAIGSPMNIFATLKEGVTALFRLPYEGLLLDDSPGAFLLGLCRGVLKLLAAILSVSLNVSVKAFGILSFSATFCTFDEHYQQRKIGTSRRRHPRNVLRGLITGTEQLAYALVDALMGPFVQIYRYGIRRGCWRVLVGFVFKPLDGASDFVGKTMEGLMNQFSAEFDRDVWLRRNEIREGAVLTKPELYRLFQLVQKVESMYDVDLETGQVYTSRRRTATITASSPKPNHRAGGRRRFWEFWKTQTASVPRPDAEDDESPQWIGNANSKIDVEYYVPVKWSTPRGQLRDRIAVRSRRFIILWDSLDERDSVEELYLIPRELICNVACSHFDTYLEISHGPPTNVETTLLIGAFVSNIAKAKTA
eukprot:ANDGO_03327.mRNA.1 Vacuolar protein sorting-associated protein 13a